MTDAREIDGFCTDCGNWTDLRGPIGDRRCRCGSGRVAVPPAGYRILGPDEVDPVTLERAAALVERDEIDGFVRLDPKRHKNLSDWFAEQRASAIRALGRKA